MDASTKGPPNFYVEVPDVPEQYVITIRRVLPSNPLVADEYGAIDCCLLYKRITGKLDMRAVILAIEGDK